MTASRIRYQRKLKGDFVLLKARRSAAKTDIKQTVPCASQTCAGVPLKPGSCEKIGREAARERLVGSRSTPGAPRGRLEGIVDRSRAGCAPVVVSFSFPGGHRVHGSLLNGTSRSSPARDSPHAEDEPLLLSYAFRGLLEQFPLILHRTLRQRDSLRIPWA